MAVVLFAARTCSGTQAALSRDNPPGNASQAPEPGAGSGHAGMCRFVVHSAAWLPHAMATRVAQGAGTVKVDSRLACTRSPVLTQRRCGSVPSPLPTCRVDVVSRPTTSRVLLYGVVGNGTLPIGSEQSRLVVPAGKAVGPGDADAVRTGDCGGGVDSRVHPPAQQTAVATTTPIIVRIMPSRPSRSLAHDPMASARTPSIAADKAVPQDEARHHKRTKAVSSTPSFANPGVHWRCWPAAPGGVGGGAGWYRG
jgi:hypothetical protein